MPPVQEEEALFAFKKDTPNIVNQKPLLLQTMQNW